MIPDHLIVDLSGPRRLTSVRVIGGTIYGETRSHPDGAPTADDAIVALGDLDGAATVEVRPNRRWTAGEWTATRSTGCNCGGKHRALRAWSPTT